MDDENTITCPNCGWSGDIDDCSSPGESIQIYCPECGHDLLEE